MAYRNNRYMKKILFILPLAAMIAVFTSCGGENRPDARKGIVLQQGCYTSADTAYVLVFPDKQHDGQWLTLTYLGENGMEAFIPDILSEYNDSTGSGIFYAGSEMLRLRTNGKDSVWLSHEGDTISFVRKAKVDYAPKNLTGEWRLSYQINEYMSLRILDAVISDNLHCDITFNIPDSAQLMSMIEMMGDMEGQEGMGDMLPEGMPLNALLQALPREMQGDIWYSAYAGMGVFVPDLDDLMSSMPVPEGETAPNAADVNSDYGMFFTTPNGKTIRLTFGEEGMNLTRLK